MTGLQSFDLSFPSDYLYGKDEDRLFNMLTEDYMFKCDNYAVAYNLLNILKNFDMLEHSEIRDDCFYIYSWIIFITCLPKDIERIKHIAKRLPSSFCPNVKIYRYDEDTGEDVEI